MNLLRKISTSLGLNTTSGKETVDIEKVKDLMRKLLQTTEVYQHHQTLISKNNAIWGEYENLIQINKAIASLLKQLENSSNPKVIMSRRKYETFKPFFNESVNLIGRMSERTGASSAETLKHIVELGNLFLSTES